MKSVDDVTALKMQTELRRFELAAANFQTKGLRSNCRSSVCMYFSWTCIICRFCSLYHHYCTYIDDILHHEPVWIWNLNCYSSKETFKVKVDMETRIAIFQWRADQEQNHYIFPSKMLFIWWRPASWDESLHFLVKVLFKWWRPTSWDESLHFLAKVLFKWWRPTSWDESCQEIFCRS